MEAVPPIAAELPVETRIPESTVQAQVKIRKAVYVGTGKWTVQYDKSREVSFEGEALEWLYDFQNNKIAAPPGSFLSVTMRVSEIRLDRNGDPVDEPTYTIVRVHGTQPPSEQSHLF